MLQKYMLPPSSGKKTEAALISETLVKVSETTRRKDSRLETTWTSTVYTVKAQNSPHKV
jgi:hypothetical protein